MSYEDRRIELLGPYRVDYADDNVNEDIILLGDPLPDHTIVVAIWALFPVGWKSDTNADCDFKIGVASDPSSLFNVVLKEYLAPGVGTYTITEPLSAIAGVAHITGASLLHAHSVPSGTDADGGSTEIGGPTGPSVPATRSSTVGGIGIVEYAAWTEAAGETVTSIQIAVEAYVNGGDHFVQGQADVYALIATV